MTYANFKASVKKVNLKPKGVQEIVLEISGDELDGQLEAIAQMVDLKVGVELDAENILFKKKINEATNMPLQQYHVTAKGIVEVKQPDQLELDGMPEEKVKIREEYAVLDREVIDQFVLSGLSPNYDDYHENLIDILKRRIAGESYKTLAAEYDLSADELVEQIKMYRMHVAPLAEAWHKWVTDKDTNY